MKSQLSPEQKSCAKLLKRALARNPHSVLVILRDAAGNDLMFENLDAKGLAFELTMATRFATDSILYTTEANQARLTFEAEHPELFGATQQ